MKSARYEDMVERKRAEREDAQWLAHARASKWAAYERVLDKGKRQEWDGSIGVSSDILRKRK